MVTNYPVSIPAHGMALNMTVQSYNGSLDFGLTACRRAVPDVRDVADHLVEALAELKAAVAARSPVLPAVAAAIEVAKPPVRKRGNAKPAPPAAVSKVATKRLRQAKPSGVAH